MTSTGTRTWYAAVALGTVVAVAWLGQSTTLRAQVPAGGTKNTATPDLKFKLSEPSPFPKFPPVKPRPATKPGTGEGSGTGLRRILFFYDSEKGKEKALQVINATETGSAAGGTPTANITRAARLGCRAVGMPRAVRRIGGRNEFS